MYKVKKKKKKPIQHICFPRIQGDTFKFIIGLTNSQKQQMLTFHTVQLVNVLSFLHKNVLNISDDTLNKSLNQLFQYLKNPLS